MSHYFFILNESNEFVSNESNLLKYQVVRVDKTTEQA